MNRMKYYMYNSSSLKRSTYKNNTHKDIKKEIKNMKQK